MADFRKVFPQLLSIDWVSALFYNLFNKLSIVFINLGSFIILVRILDEEQMGGWALFLSISTMIEIARGALVRNGMILYLNSSDTKEHIQIHSAGLCLNLAAGLISAIILLLIAYPLGTFWDYPSLQKMLYVYAISTLFLTFFLHVEILLQAKNNFKAVFYMYLFKQGLFLAGIVLLLFFPGDDILTTLIYFHCISILGATIFAVIFSYKEFLFTLKVSKEWIKKLWEYGRLVLATNLNSLIFRNTDQLMIATFISTSAVAYYNVAIRITNFLDLPSTAAAEALFPKSVQMSQSNNTDKTKVFYEKLVGTTLAIMVPCCFAMLLFPEITLKLIAGSKYLQASHILQITLVYSLFLPFLKQFGMVMDSSGKPGVNTRLVIFLSLINIVLNYILINTLGIIGAAYATLATYFIGAISSLIVLNKYFNITIQGVVKQAVSAYQLLASKVNYKISSKTANH